MIYEFELEVCSEHSRKSHFRRPRFFISEDQNARKSPLFCGRNQLWISLCLVCYINCLMLGISEKLNFKPYKCEVLCTDHEFWWIRAPDSITQFCMGCNTKCHRASQGVREYKGVYGETPICGFAIICFNNLLDSTNEH